MVRLADHRAITTATRSAISGPITGGRGISGGSGRGRRHRRSRPTDGPPGGPAGHPRGELPVLSPADVLEAPAGDRRRSGAVVVRRPAHLRPPSRPV